MIKRGEEPLVSASLQYPSVSCGAHKTTIRGQRSASDGHVVSCGASSYTVHAVQWSVRQSRHRLPQSSILNAAVAKICQSFTELNKQDAGGNLARIFILGTAYISVEMALEALEAFLEPRMHKQQTGHSYLCQCV